MADDKDNKGKGGYGRPPKHSQFKPKQSGNPKGRPRKLLPERGESMLEEFIRLGKEEIEFTEKNTGRTQMLPRRTVALLKIWSDTYQSSKTAFEVLNLHGTEIVHGKDKEEMSREDEEILARMAKRYANENEVGDAVEGQEQTSDPSDGETS